MYARSQTAVGDQTLARPDPDAVLLGGITLLRAFSGLGAQVLVIPADERDCACWSRYAKTCGLFLSDLYADEQRFLERLLRIGESAAGSPTLFYGDDVTLSFVSRYRECLGRHFRLTLPRHELVEDCLDKRRFAALCTRHGLRAPRVFAVDTSEQTVLCPSVSDDAFPLLLKPDTHVGWHAQVSSCHDDGMPRKALLIPDIGALRERAQQLRALGRAFVLQQFVPGGEDSIYSYHAYVTSTGLVAASFAGRKIRTFPSDMGESSFVELIEDHAVEALGRELITTLDIRGPVKIDLKRHPDTGVLYVLEINLRYTLWNQLGAYCGASLPAAALQEGRGERCTLSGGYRTDVAWLRMGLDRRAFFGDYLPSGQLSITSWLRSLLRPMIHPIWAWRDPLPFVRHMLARIVPRQRREADE